MDTSWLSDVDKPRFGESYREYLDRHRAIGSGFSIDELARLKHPRRGMPPNQFWPNIVPTMRLAIHLRERLIEQGGHGLLIAAAYRPSGGAAKSKHKINAALDLDLLPQDAALGDVWYALATRVWCEYGRATHMGLGLYCRPSATAGIRIHIDAFCRRAPATWQHSGSLIVSRPADRAAMRIIARDNLKAP